MQIFHLHKEIKMEKEIERSLFKVRQFKYLHGDQALFKVTLKRFNG